MMQLHLLFADGLAATDASEAPEKNQAGFSFIVWYISNILSIILTAILVVVIVMEVSSMSMVWWG